MINPMDELMTKAGSIRKLATAIGAAPATVQYWSKTRRLPPLEYLYAIEQKFGIPSRKWVYFAHQQRVGQAPSEEPLTGTNG